MDLLLQQILGLCHVLAYFGSFITIILVTGSCRSIEDNEVVDAAAINAADSLRVYVIAERPDHAKLAATATITKRVAADVEYMAAQTICV